MSLHFWVQGRHRLLAACRARCVKQANATVAAAEVKSKRRVVCQPLLTGTLFSPVFALRLLDDREQLHGPTCWAYEQVACVEKTARRAGKPQVLCGCQRMQWDFEIREDAVVVTPEDQLRRRLRQQLTQEGDLEKSEVHFCMRS